MALEVEDGTGKANADSFGSLAAFKLWADGRARVYSAYADAAIEAALREGFQYINTKRRYKGSIASTTQVAAFPREGLTDWDGRTVTGVPIRVVWANFELAWSRLIGGADLFQDLERGGHLASKTTGPISKSWFAGSPVGVVYMAAMALLDPYARSVQDSFAPFIGGAAGQASTEAAATELTPLFGVGMHANNEG